MRVRSLEAMRRLFVLVLLTTLEDVQVLLGSGFDLSPE
jgi:hypothetical protein